MFVTYTLSYIRIPFIRILRLRFGTNFSENGEIFARYKRKVCQMKQQVKRNSLRIYLGVGWVENHQTFASYLRISQAQVGANIYRRLISGDKRVPPFIITCAASYSNTIVIILCDPSAAPVKTYGEYPPLGLKYSNTQTKKNYTFYHNSSSKAYEWLWFYEAPQ